MEMHKKLLFSAYCTNITWDMFFGKFSGVGGVFCCLNMFFISFRNRNNIISLVKFMLSGYCMNIFAGILYTGDTLVFCSF